MPSGAEEAAQAARKAKGLPPTQTPEQFYGGIIAKLIIKEINMGSISKLLGGVVGSLVGTAVAYLAVKGLASCTNAADVATCSVLGIGEGQISTAIVTAVTGAFIFFFPANKPS